MGLHPIVERIDSNMGEVGHLDTTEKLAAYENVTMKSARWGYLRRDGGQRARMYHVDSSTKLEAKMDDLHQMVTHMYTVESMGSTSIPSSLECMAIEQANWARNTKNNPFSQTYNQKPGWRNHPNLSYPNQNAAQNS